MIDHPKTTLEQWLVLQTVVEAGSFSRAAEQLARSQSSVSYALQNLQERLGLELLHIVGRKAELTAAGQLLLNQAAPLVQSLRQLEARARSMSAGIRASLSLCVDCMFPKPLLFQALRRFQQQWPETQVHVSEILRSESQREQLRAEADLLLLAEPPGCQLRGNLLLELDFIAVAAADHPLCLLPGPVSPAQLASYSLVSITDRQHQRTELRRQRAVWSFSTADAAIEAISHGVGYGWLPRFLVAPFLASGELQALPLSSQASRKTPIYLSYGDDALSYDPAVAGLAAIIQQVVADAKNSSQPDVSGLFTLP